MILHLRVPPIYAITDPSRGAHQDLVLALVAAGVQWIQIREKEMPDAVLLMELTSIVRAVPSGVTLLVNDRADLAIASGAHGVHLGDDDLPPRLARRAAGNRHLLIGFSTHDPGEARDAAADPAVDYIAVGPVYRSPTKDVREPRGLELVREVRGMTDKPLVAIGGIDRTNIAEVLRAGADSAAVISALYSGASIAENVRALIEEAGSAR